MKKSLPSMVIKDKVLKMFDEQVGEGTALRSLLGQLKGKDGKPLVDMDAMRKTLEKSLDATLQSGLTPVQRAQAFAKTAQEISEKNAAQFQINRGQGQENKNEEQEGGKKQKPPPAAIIKEDPPPESEEKPEPPVTPHTGYQQPKLEGFDTLGEKPSLNSGDEGYDFMLAALKGAKEGEVIVSVVGKQVLMARYKDGKALVENISDTLAKHAGKDDVRDMVAAMRYVDSDKGDKDNPAAQDLFVEYRTAVAAWKSAWDNKEDKVSSQQLLLLKNKMEAAAHAMEVHYKGILKSPKNGEPSGPPVRLGEEYAKASTSVKTITVSAGTLYRNQSGNYGYTKRDFNVADTPDMRDKFDLEARGENSDSDRESLTETAKISFSPRGETMERFLVDASHATGQGAQNDDQTPALKPSADNDQDLNQDIA